MNLLHCNYFGSNEFNIAMIMSGKMLEIRVLLKCSHDRPWAISFEIITLNITYVSALHLL